MSDTRSSEQLHNGTIRDEEMSEAATNDMIQESDESMAISEVSTNDIVTPFRSSILNSLDPNYTIRLIIDVKSIVKMDLTAKNKVYAFLVKLGVMLRRNNIPLTKIEYYLADELCQPTYEFADKLNDYISNHRHIPSLKSTIEGFGFTRISNLWYIVTTFYKKKDLKLDLPAKLKKVVILDYGKNVRHQDKNLPLHKVVPCFAHRGIPIIPEMVEVLTPNNRSETTESVDSSMQQSAQQQTDEYEQDCRDVEEHIANDGYNQKDLLGIGGYGEVYKFSRPDGTNFALKFQKISDDARKDIDQEMEIFKLLENNAFFAVIPYHHTQTNRMMAQWLHTYANGDLHRCITSNMLNENQKQNVMGALAQGLIFLRTQNLLHLDIKTLNILMDDGLRPTISDFGLAQHGPEAILDVPTGTAGFGSPEAWMVKLVNDRSDIFSLGVVYHWLWNNRPVFTNRQIKFRFQEDFWENWVPNVTCGRWSSLVESMIAPDPESRPSAENVLEQMRNVRQTEYHPFHLVPSVSSQTLNNRAIFSYAFSAFAHINVREQMTSAHFSKAVERLSEGSGVSGVTRKIRKGDITFSLSTPPAPRNSINEYYNIKKFGKKWLVKLYFGQDEVTHYEIKTHYRQLAENITIELAKMTGMYQNMNENDLKSKLHNFLSLH